VAREALEWADGNSTLVEFTARCADGRPCATSASLARFNRRVTIALSARCPRLPGSASSSTPDASPARVPTPVQTSFRRPEGYSFCPTGPESDWVRNVLANGGCTLETRARDQACPAALVPRHRVGPPCRTCPPDPGPRWRRRLPDLTPCRSLYPRTDVSQPTSLRSFRPLRWSCWFSRS